MAYSSTIRDTISEKDDFAVSGKKQIKFCQPCSRKNGQSEAQHFCIDCVEYQCSECSVAHKAFSFAINHNVVSEQEADQFTVSFDMKGLDQCKIHTKIFEFICEDHDQLCCSTCAIVSHRKCQSVVEVDQKACSEMKNITTLKNDLTTIRQNAEATVQIIASKTSKFSSDALKVKGNMLSLKENVQKLFEGWENSADRKIEEFQQQLFEEYDTLTSSCKSRIDVVTKVLSDLQSVSENGTPSQQIIFCHQLKGQVIKLKKNNDKVRETVRDAIICIDINDFLKLPPVEELEPWKVTAKYIIPNQNPICQNKYTKTDLKLRSSVMLTEGEKDQASFTGMDFLPDGRLVAVQYVGDECLVFNPQLQKVGSKILTFGPRGISAISEQEVNADTVYICDINDNTSIEVKGDNINDPRGVAVGPDDSIFVCCQKEYTYSMVHLSSSGKLIASYKLDIPYPHIVCVTKDKTKMAVSNASTKMLQLFEIVLTD